MVGLALVVLVAIFAAGLSASIDKTIDEQVPAAMIVQNQDGFSPIPTAVVKTVEGVRASTEVSSFRFVQGIAKGDGESTTAVNGVDPATVNSVLTLKWEEGDPQTLAA